MEHLVLAASNDPHVHADCLELVTNLSEMACSASIRDGIMTLENGTQIDLSGTVNQETKEGGDDEH